MDGRESRRRFQSERRDERAGRYIKDAVDNDYRKVWFQPPRCKLHSCPLNYSNLLPMSVLNFVSQDDLHYLDEDSRIAFMEIVNKTQRSLSTQTSKLDPQDETQWEEREKLRHSFMNAIVAAAKRFEIEPFSSMQVPTYKAYRNGTDHREFKADLDHYITQLMLDNSMRNRAGSVSILPTTKDKIRSYVHALRKCIEKSSMSDAKREALLKRLDEFETELEKRRTNLLAVARLTFELLAIPGTA